MERILEISKTLNKIRQEAGKYKTHSVVIRPHSKEWDAIFFAEILLEKMVNEATILLDISQNFKKEE